ncbi:MAG TPA: hypothetical protein VF120_00420, partial [Ktedonobacterales bacterium]
ARAWLFDVDGVLTDPEIKRVTRPALYDELSLRLMHGEPVGLNTGRSLLFIEGVLAPLEEHIPDRRQVRYLVAIGEKGGARITYDADGARIATVDQQIAIPQALRDAVVRLAAQPEYASCMFEDQTKQTMVSLELREGCSVAEFAPRQRELVEVLQRMLEAEGWNERFGIDPNRIATDVQDRHVGKALGAATFVGELAAGGVEPGRYLCFGDSAHDYDMLDALLRLGKRAELVFVGGEEMLRGKDTRLVTFTELLCDAGTLAYLQSTR